MSDIILIGLAFFVGLVLGLEMGMRLEEKYEKEGKKK
jgi:hypothetical protein